MTPRRTVLAWHCKRCLTGTLYTPAKYWPTVIVSHLAERHPE